MSNGKKEKKTKLRKMLDGIARISASSGHGGPMELIREEQRLCIIHAILHGVDPGDMVKAVNDLESRFGVELLAIIYQTMENNPKFKELIEGKEV